ncbi:MAG: hypothetical protein H8E66_32955 [Planctomycetes bacterium]|nr:hypothetical protein [Planctomycetota bacterium]
MVQIGNLNRLAYLDWNGNLISDSNTNPLELSQEALAPIQITLVSSWAVAVVAVGGIASGLAITEFKTLGLASLWLVGEVAGFVGRKLLAEKSKLAGVILVVSCVGAYVVAVVCWIHWDTVQGEESWMAAIRLLPTFVQEYKRTAVIGAISCFIGAMSAYRRVAHRYRVVHVIED